MTSKNEQWCPNSAYPFVTSYINCLNLTITIETNQKVCKSVADRIKREAVMRVKNKNSYFIQFVPFYSKFLNCIF